MNERCGWMIVNEEKDQQVCGRPDVVIVIEADDQGRAMYICHEHMSQELYLLVQKNRWKWRVI